MFGLDQLSNTREKPHIPFAFAWQSDAQERQTSPFITELEELTLNTKYWHSALKLDKRDEPYTINHGTNFRSSLIVSNCHTAKQPSRSRQFSGCFTGFV